MEEESVAFSSTANQTELWHKRLGHFNQVTLVHMQKKKKDSAKNAKPGRRNLSLYLLSIWQAEQTSISSEQGLKSNRKALAYSY